jgi:hypothetical protein
MKVEKLYTENTWDSLAWASSNKRAVQGNLLKGESYVGGERSGRFKKGVADRL